MDTLATQTATLALSAGLTSHVWLPASFHCQKLVLSLCAGLQNALDATGACCSGVVDNFGVCNGYDGSGIFQLAMTSSASASKLATALGISSSTLVLATE